MICIRAIFIVLFLFLVPTVLAYAGLPPIEENPGAPLTIIAFDENGTSTQANQTQETAKEGGAAGGGSTDINETTTTKTAATNQETQSDEQNTPTSQRDQQQTTTTQTPRNAKKTTTPKDKIPQPLTTQSTFPYELLVIPALILITAVVFIARKQRHKHLPQHVKRFK